MKILKSQTIRQILLGIFLSITLSQAWSSDLDYYMCDLNGYKIPKLLEVSDASGTHVYTFSPAGTILTYDGESIPSQNLYRNGQGYLIDLVSTYGTNQIKTTYEYLGRQVMGITIYYNGEKAMTLKQNYNDDGIVKSAEIVGVGTVKYSDYKFDNEGNWIARTTKNPAGAKISERRRIEYHSNFATFAPSIWRPFINGSLYYLMYKKENGKDLEKLPSPHKTIIINQVTGACLGTAFNSDEAAYIVFNGDKIQLFNRGTLLNTFSLVNPDNKGYLEVSDSNGTHYYLKKSNP